MSSDTRWKSKVSSSEYTCNFELAPPLANPPHSARLVMGKHSGGIACPVQLVIVEIYKSGDHKISEEFGTCTDLFKARLVNDRVIVEMRQYTAHPDAFPKKELRERDRTKVVYMWYKGKLSEKEMLL